MQLYSLMKVHDKEIIEAIKNRTNLEQAVKELYSLSFDTVASFIRKNSGNQEDAEDFFQEAIIVFIDLVQNNRFRGESKIKTFMYAIVRNLWFNELKRRKKVMFNDPVDSIHLEIEDQNNIQQAIQKDEAHKRVIDFLDQIGVNCKKILLLFYYEEMPMRDIYLKMGYESEQVARNMKYKCMKKLHLLLDDNEATKSSLKKLLTHG